MIHVQNLTYAYPGAKEKTLKNLTFKMEKGEIFGFLGPSGAGKTTTQKILYKILKGFEGEVKVGGKALEKWGKAYFETIGVGFELPNHYLKLTGKENLELFGNFYPKEKLKNISELFEQFELKDALNKRVEDYSKGMKVRLNFIRAIRHNPDLIFFDEPTAGLDPVNAHKIKQHILKLKEEGKTIFITTHNMSTADEICDRVAFIVNGELRVIEKPSILKHKHGQKRVKVELKNGKMEAFELEKLGKNADFLNFLKKDELERINTQEATLEEVFIKVTGERLAPEGGLN